MNQFSFEGYRDQLFTDQQCAAERAFNIVLMNVSSGKRIVWQYEFGIPQGPLSKQCSILIISDLPIQTAKHLLEARVREITR